MENKKIFIIVPLVLIYSIACTKKECKNAVEPFSNTLNIALDSIFKDTEVKKLKCFDVKIYTKENLPFYKGITEIFTRDTTLVFAKILANFNVTSPSIIEKVKSKNVILSVNRDEDTKGSLEVSNYYYDKEKKLGAYFFIVMLGQKGMKDFVVFYTLDDDCNAKLVSCKEIYSIPKNPIWVEKMK